MGTSPMTQIRVVGASSVFGALLLLAACGGSGTTSADAGSGASGERLYAQNCASCHGTDLRGSDSGPSHLSELYEPNHHPDEAFRSAIDQGATAHHWPFGDMPPVDGLSGEEVDAIIAYVRAEQEASGFEPYPPR